MKKVERKTEIFFLKMSRSVVFGAEHKGSMIS